MSDKRPARVSPALAELLGIARELRGLPRPDFKRRLGAELRAEIDRARQPAPRRRIATPYLMIRDAARAIDFYKRAFGAEETMRLANPAGHIAHAEIRIGEAPVMIAEEDTENFNLSPETLGGSSAMVHVYVDDVDAFARRAERRGAKVLEPPRDYSHGDRRGKFADPFGHVWMVATRKRAVSPEEIKADWERSLRSRDTVEPDPKPAGYHSITPYLQVEGAGAFIDFLKRAFDAEEVMRVNNPDGTIVHAQMRVQGSMVELADANDVFTPHPTSIWLFVKDVDEVYRKALAAGASSIHEPMNQDYGNREAVVKDPFGNNWYIATPLPDAQPWPPELRSVTPYLHPKGASKLIDFLKNAFDAEEVARHADERGVVHHAQLRIGDSIIAMGEAHGQFQPMPPALHLYVRDVDAVYAKALRAGAKSMYAPRDEAYGDRSGGVTDPFGNVWYIATRRRQERESRGGTLSSAAPAAIMPFVYVESAEAAAEFCAKVFEARELHRETDPGGQVSHIQIAIGNTNLMLCGVRAPHYEESIAKGFVRTPGQLGGTPLHLYVHVPDADAAFRRAIEAGSKIVNPLRDEGWGDRCGGVQDPFGHIWYIATPLKDLGR